MKIALVGDYPPPFGGVSVHVAALERALAARSVDLRVLDIGRGQNDAPGVAPARGALRCAVALARAAAERRLIHVHTSGANPKSWLLALAASRARLPGSPLPLLTLHSGLLPVYLARYAERREVARAVCSSFGRVVAVSHELSATLEGCGVPAARLEVVPAFLHAGLVPGAPPARFTAFREARAPLFCAALAPTSTYGEDVLLAAFAAVSDREPRAGLVVFGEGSERGPVAALGLRQGVLALGEIDHAAALGVLGACDVFVRPTRADGDALSVREALSLGRKVVASEVGQRPPGCLLFRAGDAAGLAALMIDAARSAPAPPGHGRPDRDPLESLLAIYRSLARERPIPSDSARLEQAPCSTP
ncbi:MAG: glycosyl transferase [Anaeromyxobacter sp. RBG_16_69_14]|nr:MAG: glycosyl transferase [Anaeromyxobacter sp. RBG_16_69_14]